MNIIGMPNSAFQVQAFRPPISLLLVLDVNFWDSLTITGLQAKLKYK